MPFRSKAQARYMWANHPDIAQRFADETPQIKALPEHVGDKKRKPKLKRKKKAKQA